MYTCPPSTRGQDLSSSSMYTRILCKSICNLKEYKPVASIASSAFLRNLKNNKLTWVTRSITRSSCCCFNSFGNLTSNTQSFTYTSHKQAHVRKVIMMADKLKLSFIQITHVPRDSSNVYLYLTQGLNEYFPQSFTYTSTLMKI